MNPPFCTSIALRCNPAIGSSTETHVGFPKTFALGARTAHGSNGQPPRSSPHRVQRVSRPGPVERDDRVRDRPRARDPGADRPPLLVVTFMHERYLATGTAPSIRALGKESGVPIKEL